MSLIWRDQVPARRGLYWVQGRSRRAKALFRMGLGQREDPAMLPFMWRRTLSKSTERRRFDVRLEQQLHLCLLTGRPSQFR